MASKLRTDFQPGEVFHADYINRANAQTNANTQDLNEVKDNIATTAENAQIATQAATDTAGYMSALNTAIEALPDGQAVSAEVAEHTVQIAGLDTATTLGEDSHGNAIKPSDVQSAMSSKEFLEVKTDSQGNLLWTLGTDGKLQMNVPISFESDTHGVKDDRLQNYYTMASKEWIELVLDENDNIIFGIKTSGEVVASSMDANLVSSTITAISEGIRQEYDDTITSLKAEASDPLDKYVSLASGISQDDIDNGTSKYHDIARKSSDVNMSKQACSVLYNLMKLEKENRFLATHWLNIDYRADFHRNPNGYRIGNVDYENYRDQFRIKEEITIDGVTTNVYTPKEPSNTTFEFDPLTRHAYYMDGTTEVIYPSSGVVSNKTPILYIFDMRSFTDLHEYTADRRAEYKAIMLTLIKKAWVDYKAIPVFCWHEPNPYVPYAKSSSAASQYFSGGGFNYTYDDTGYPQNHRYVISEILENVKKVPSDGEAMDAYPSDTYTCCGFDSSNSYTFDCPSEWFDARCQEVGQYIREVNAFVNNMTLSEWDGDGLTTEELSAWKLERKELEIPIIFRLWHECETGSMWWGAPMTNSPEEYKDFYKLTVQKLRSYSESNSLMFGFCLENLFYTPLVGKYDKFGTRYPGDDYVDIVGYDEYSMGKPNQTPICVSRMKVVSSFAKEHSKPAFIWECGNKTPVEDWYNTWVAAMQTAGINFAALMGWGSSYPPNITKLVPTAQDYEQKKAQLLKQLNDYAQYYRRSNMPCAEDNFDLTTISNS